MLAPKGDLAAAEIAFFAPALLISLFIVFRHGLSKQLGWLYLVILSILRIIGASATLYMDVNKDLSKSLIETAAITSAVGTAPLLLALMGFLERINTNMEQKGLSKMTFRPIHLTSIAAFVIAIIGGVNETDNSLTKQDTGKKLMEAAAILFLVIWLALTAITLYNTMNYRYTLASEKYLLRAAVIAIPFLLVRVAYTVAVAFSSRGSDFDFRDVNVWIQAFMQFLMEVIVVCLYIFAGLMTPKHEKRQIREGSSDVEEGQKYEMNGRPQRETGRRTYGQGQQAPRQQRQRSLWDYRPSKLIMDAVRDRQ